MAEKCFLSFNYKPDNWRVSQVRHIGSIEEQPLLASNKWEEIKQGGDEAVKKWIADNMKGKKCLVVLVGKNTSSRKWVKYEIKKAWKDGLGVVAIYIHNLKDKDGNQSEKGTDPFVGLSVGGEAVTGKVYDPPYTTSTYVYDHIASNIESWIVAAVRARA